MAKVAGISSTVTSVMLSTGPTLIFATKVPSIPLFVLSYALMTILDGSNSDVSILNFDNSFKGQTFRAEPSELEPSSMVIRAYDNTRGAIIQSRAIVNHHV